MTSFLDKFLMLLCLCDGTSGVSRCHDLNCVLEIMWSDTYYEIVEYSHLYRVSRKFLCFHRFSRYVAKLLWSSFLELNMPKMT